MQLAIIGAGWVGVTTAAAFADIGHTVVCADIDQNRIDLLRKGEVPFFEPGLADLLAKALNSGRLSFTTSNVDAMKLAEVIFCCVFTPTLENGTTDLKAVMAVAQDFARTHEPEAVFVIKSTVPAGTGAKVHALIASASSTSFAVASNPEFLAESTAIRDTLEPSRIVIGCDDAAAGDRVAAVYASITYTGAKLFRTDLTTAEVIKCASNSFLATKISFMNEIANYANQVGANPMDVAAGMGLDPRIGRVRPGVGYGGGCFPKDVKALLEEGVRSGQRLTVLQAAHDANYRQRTLLYERMSAALNGVAGRRVAIWGLAFKPQTDDTRDAPALYFVERLLKEGASVVVFDPQVRRSLVEEFPGLEFASSATEAARGADALALLCEWPEFQEISVDDIRSLLKGNTLVDGRYGWSRTEIEGRGLTYVV